ncbi:MULTISPECIES: sterol desaturase family protein [Persicobacter]|uniref:Beta-carotene hydroxylase n=1 Tax=Persicobacter diffluens TaxID=981 RepID=A0AAN4W0M9_9BACT|nr:sterol desaturase family protein [Persicobacter sp. CCB-QB2]GJM62147.1 beta-carotene hydroxylase [Persicobacter diffluens]
MAILMNILLVIGSFLFMEGVAWFTHKYIMHGILWSWHKDHHTVHNKTLEKNDLFAVVFSIPAIVMIVLGSEIPEWRFLLYIGLGVTLYGIFYSVFHDIIVHRRIKYKYKFKSAYMKRIMKAHYIHHAVHTKEGAQAFGFLWAPKKYEKQSITAKEEKEASRTEAHSH